MATNSDLEKWQKAIQGIEARLNELTSEELSAFQALKELYINGNFESSDSGGNMKVIKNALIQHSNHRILKAHLTNFADLCEQFFKNKAVVPTVGTTTYSAPQPPIPQEQPVTIPPSFGGIPDEDMNKWQDTIRKIEKLKSNLTPDELSAFETLSANSRDGNFEWSGSVHLIHVLKKHSNNRALQKVHLPNFIALCEKYFHTQPIAPKFEPPKFEPPKIVPPKIVPPPTSVVPEPPKPEIGNNDAGKGNNGKSILLVALLAVLVGGWFVYKNLDVIKAKLGMEEEAIPETVASHPLLGAWQGLLNNEEATLEFLSIDTISNEVKAQIYFAGNNDTLTVSGTMKSYQIDLQDDADGIYRGTLENDSSIFSGTFLANTGVSSTFRFGNPYKETEEPPFEFGLWQGVLNNVPATFEFLSIKDGKAEAQIHFPENNQIEKASGSIDSTMLNLTDEIENGFYDGLYLGKLQNNYSVFSGKFYDKHTGETLDFNFSKYPDLQVETDSVVLSEVMKPEENEPEANIPKEEVNKPKEEVNKPQREQAKSADNRKKNEPASTSQGAVAYSGGSYRGDLKNNQPHGMGTIYYNARTLIDSRDMKKRYAEAGQYLVGQFRDGRLLQGKLFDKADNQIETIIIGGGVY